MWWSKNWRNFQKSEIKLFFWSVFQKQINLSYPQLILLWLFPLSDFIEEEEEDGQIPPNPMAAAGAVKDALATGGVDKVADMGKQSAAKLGGMVTKGIGGFAGKALGSFFWRFRRFVSCQSSNPYGRKIAVNKCSCPILGSCWNVRWSR